MMKRPGEEVLYTSENVLISTTRFVFVTDEHPNGQTYAASIIGKVRMDSNWVGMPGAVVGATIAVLGFLTIMWAAFAIGVALAIVGLVVGAVSLAANEYTLVISTNRQDDVPVYKLTDRTQAQQILDAMNGAIVSRG